MRVCPRCARESADDANVCECGYSFLRGGYLPPAVGPASRTLASLGSRLVAQFLDGLIGGVPFLLLLPLLLIPGVPEESIVLAAILGGAFYMVYFLFSDGLPGGQSLGKRVMKIAVVFDDGRPCTYLGSLIRNWIQILGFFDWVWIFGEKRRRAGDYIAGTWVVEQRP
jgi:uncharacterized RDD family membrane protein YckC